MKKLSLDKKWIYVIFLLSIIAIGFYSINDRNIKIQNNNISSECMIKYSYPKVINGTISVGFYNPTKYDMTKIKVIVPKFNGIDIYNVDKPLMSHETKVLTFFNYRGSIKDVNKFVVSWCCNEDCYQTKLNNFSSSIKVGISNFTVNYTYNLSKNGENNNSDYPVHPKMSDCQELNNTIIRQFCYSDVAEITDNLTICERFVYDHDINPFCVARVTLNKTLCNNILDDNLRQSCIDSINIKKKWESE